MFGFTKLSGTDAGNLFTEFVSLFLVLDELLFEAGKLLLCENQCQLQLAPLIFDFATLRVEGIELAIVLLLDARENVIQVLSGAGRQTIRTALEYFDELLLPCFEIFGRLGGVI